MLRPIAGLPPLGPETGTSDETIRNRLRMLAAVDEGLGQILAALEAQQQLDDTLSSSRATTATSTASTA